MIETQPEVPEARSIIQTEAAGSPVAWEPRPGWQRLLIYAGWVFLCFQYRNPARLATMSAMVVLLYAVYVK